MKKSFHYLSMAIQAALQKRLMDELKGTDLTLGQPKVLDYLKDYDGVSQKEIASGCHIEPGSLTSILNRMEQKGLIERRSLNGNRRTCYIFLTTYGAECCDLVDQKFCEIESEAFEGLTDQQTEEFLKVFEQVYQNLYDIGKISREKNSKKKEE